MTLSHLMNLRVHVDRRMSQSLVMLIDGRMGTRKGVIDPVNCSCSLSLRFVQLCTTSDKVRVLSGSLLRSYLLGLNIALVEQVTCTGRMVSHVVASD